MRLKNLLLLMFLLFLISPSYALKTHRITLKSAVVFNTLCAKCHEGQCSGRLSFDNGSKAASNHIARYTEDKSITENELKEYFTLLNYMKKECLLFMPDSISYTMDTISNFAVSGYKRYFIPLGKLDKGAYLLHIQIEENIHFDFEIISNQFDSYLRQSFCPDIKKNIFEFIVDENIEYFLRVNSKKPLHFKNLEIKKL